MSQNVTKNSTLEGRILDLEKRLAHIEALEGLAAGGLDNVVEDTTPQLGGDLDLNGHNIDFPTTPNISDVLDEDNMASDSATKLATQQSIKAYADTKMADLSDDTSPTLGGDLDCSDKDLNNIKSVDFQDEHDDGNSSTADTIDWNEGPNHKSTMTGNCTYTFTAPAGPGHLQLKLVQDATGSRTATWPGTVKWPGGTAPTLSTGANEIDIISFYWDGTNYFGVSLLDFS